MFDLDKTRAVARLFTAPEQDDAWREQFYAAIPDASLRAFDPQVEQGPDGFPYFHLAIPESGPLTPFSISHVLDHCLESGFGAVIFPDSSRTAPAWVFTYGNLLSFKLYGHFDHDPAEPARAARSGSTVLEEEHALLVGAPSEAYFPACARRAMGAFFRNILRHPDPRIALVVDPKLDPPRHLMVNLSSGDYGGDGQKLGAAFRYLSWFVPGNYAFMALPPGWSTDSFVPLG
jgi:hypothetical protein